MTNFLSNALNEYETYTYNIKLWQVDPRDFGQGDNLIKTERAILIADNARLAEYNIVDMEQVFTVGHGQVREAFGNTFRLTVNEPNGVTLLSTIKGASINLGINNHLQAGYLIEVEFNGRVADGTAKKFPQKFYYTGKITDFTFRIDEGGSTYTIEIVEQSAIGYQYLKNRVPGQVTVVAQTVGEFFSEFERLINETMIDLWVANPTAQQYPTQYRFEFDETTESWRDWRFQVLDEALTVSGIEFVGAPGQDPSLQISVPNGTQMTTVFSYVLQLTEEYKRILVEQRGFSREVYARSQPNSRVDDVELDSLPVFMKVLSNIEYGEFDLFAQDYAHNIVYRLKAYTVTDLVLDADVYSRGITSQSIQSRRVSNIVAGGYLRKRYDYTFTGRNTEILNLDMDFNYAYYQILPFGEGYFGDPRVQGPRLLQDQPEIQGRLEAIARDTQAVADAQRQLNTFRNEGQPENIIQASAGELANLRLSLNQTIENETAQLREQYGLTDQQIAMPLRWVQDVIGGQETNSSDNDENSGALKFGGVRVNLESSADFHTIEMEIRGDPYWMGKPNSFRQAENNVEDLADYEAGSINFFLVINFPTAEEDSSGRRAPNPDYQLSGLYRVISVINRFRNGQFVQYLEATRDLGTNIQSAWEALAGDDNVARATEDSRRRANQRDLAQEQDESYRRAAGIE